MADNPIRISFVEGWNEVSSLLGRLDELRTRVGKTGVVPATWEPGFDVSPRIRDARSFENAREQLLDPIRFATAFALFSSGKNPLSNRHERANYLLLRSEREGSRITREMMIKEAFEIWDYHAPEYLCKLADRATVLGVRIAPGKLHQLALKALEPLRPNLIPSQTSYDPEIPIAEDSEGGFDPELMHCGAWSNTPESKVIYFDGIISKLRSRLLLLDPEKITLLEGDHAVWTLRWDRIAGANIEAGIIEIYGFDGRVQTLQGLRNPVMAIGDIRNHFQAVTERTLGKLARKLRSN